MSKSKKTKAQEKAEREALSPAERGRRELYDWIESLMVALIFCVILFSFVLRLINVSGPSMNPTLYEGNKMLVSDLFYKPKAGDVVVFKNLDDNNEEKALVKRVIATEGQEINILVLTGAILEEDSYISEHALGQSDVDYPFRVPTGQLFVLGDNRNSSRDSRARSIGMVDERLIIGRVYAVVYPIDAIRWVK